MNGASLEIKKKVQLINEKLSYSKMPITEQLTNLPEAAIPHSLEAFKSNVTV